jgi:hypothetical protein
MTLMIARGNTLAGLVILAALVPAAAAAGQAAADAEPARELLRKNAEAGAWIESASMRYKYEYEQRGNNPGRGTYDGVISRDGDLFALVREQFVTSPDGSTQNPSNGRHRDVFGKEWYLHAYPAFGGSHARVRPVDEAERRTYRNLEQAGFFLDGRRARLAKDGDRDRTVAEVLAEAPDLRLRPEPEVIDGAECRVVEGTTPYGRFTLWIDPARGHHAIKCVDEIRPGDLLRGEPFKSHATTTVDEVKLEQVDGVWVVVSGRRVERTLDKSGAEVYGNTATCTRSEVKLKPDFAEIGAFEVNFTAGQIVRKGGQERFRWTSAKPVHIDHIMDALEPAPAPPE